MNFCSSFLSNGNISTHELDCVKVRVFVWRGCGGGGRDGAEFALEHPYQLLLVLVGMFCGWILLQRSLARCQHDLQRSESLSHIT